MNAILRSGWIWLNRAGGQRWSGASTFRASRLSASCPLLTTVDSPGVQMFRFLVCAISTSPGTGSALRATSLTPASPAPARLLISIAYRMLGSATDAEDIVQDAFLRWLQIDAETIQSPKAFLSTIVVRLC